MTTGTNPSMRVLGLVQGLARILRQIGTQKQRRLRDGQAQIVEIFHRRLQPCSAAAEQMAAALVVVGQEMQVQRAAIASSRD
jgi:hypothetical protein